MNFLDLRNIFVALGLNCFSYSGRGMYGKKCLAVEISSNRNLFELGGLVAREIDDINSDFDGELDFEWMSDARTDSLGRGMVLYFPEIAWEEDSEESEECSSCLGYGYVNELGNPTIDRRDRKCLDCRGEGKVSK